MKAEPAPDHGVSFREAMGVWARVAALSFGGPAGQIAVMHRMLVEEKRWIGEQRFLHALNYCMLLPGPEAQQLAIYIGWLMHKTKGGLVAGALFVLPGFISIMVLSWFYAAFGHLPLVDALFFGLKAAVLAVVLEAVRRIGSRALKNGGMVAVAAASFAAIFFLGVPFPIIILTAALIGYFGERAGVAAFSGGGGGHGGGGGKEVADADTLLGEEVPAHAGPNWRWSLRISSVFLFLWLAPLVALFLALGPDNVFTKIGAFFSAMAVVTFGGAYAVLAYVAQQAVQHYHWLAPGEMLDGLGMAETTPGPLIIVTQFVGFLGAFRQATGLSPMIAGTLGAILTTWVTFTPCFLWIFLGAPFIEKMRGNKALAAALGAITAAVVGVVLNLAVWFALHTLFGQVIASRYGPLTLEVPSWTTLRLPALILTACALVAVFRFKAGPMIVIPGCAAAGLIWWAIRGV
jgi:chromate transporter